MIQSFSAPWGKPLIWASMLVTLLCLTATILPAVLLHDVTGWLLFAIQWAPIVLLGACLPFVVRGYGVTEDAVLIRRLGWTTRLARAGLLAAEVAPGAMRGSLRTCGNGGAFSITGWYWNKRLGFYRAYVTDFNCTVVLRFANRKTVVISPGEPEGFVRALAF